MSQSTFAMTLRLFLSHFLFEHEFYGNLFVQHVVAVDKSSLLVFPPALPKSSVYYVMQQLKQELPSIVVKVRFESQTTSDYPHYYALGHTKYNKGNHSC